MTFGWLLIFTTIYFQGLQMLELQIKTSIIKYRQGMRMAWRNTKMQTGLQTWIINAAWDSSAESPRTSLTLLLFCPFFYCLFSFFSLFSSVWCSLLLWRSRLALCRRRENEIWREGEIWRQILRLILFFAFDYTKASAFITEARAGASNTIFWLVIKLTGGGITLPPVEPRSRLTPT